MGGHLAAGRGADDRRRLAPVPETVIVPRPYARKKEVLHCLFAVSAADDSISIPEEEAIREIANELLLTHEDYVSMRSAHREKRSVFQKP